MSTAPHILPEQDKVSLFFKNRRLEKQFRLSYDLDIRIPLRYGILISIGSWLCSLIFVYVIIPEKFAMLSLLTVGTIILFFAFVVYATFNDRFKGYFHLLGALSNAAAGFYAIYFCHQFPNGEIITLPTLIFIIFFGSYMVRLRWIAGVSAAILFILGFHFYIAQYSVLPGSQTLMLAFVGWLTLLFAFVASRISEINSRIRFIQRKMIRDQSTIIRKEKEASDKLLQNILPPYIANRLKDGEEIIADVHEDASVLFADLSGFTDFSNKLTPKQVVSILNHIFSHFDILTEKYRLEKIKTIGDGYMVAGGLSEHSKDHLHRLASLSLEMVEFIKTDEQIRNWGIDLRIGINCGNVVAGVIGIKKFTFDLWGNTVNMASRMESHGVKGKIHVSSQVKEKLDQHFDFEKREIINIKGKGDTQTYFLEGAKVVEHIKTPEEMHANS